VKVEDSVEHGSLLHGGINYQVSVFCIVYVSWLSGVSKQFGVCCRIYNTSFL
jgi:hypothetical protein